jgi:ATP-dependent Clp protease ATP-binding subunit ClpX
MKLICVNLFLCKVKLHFTENAQRLIAKKAAARETGSRELRSIMEEILTEAMFEVTSILIGRLSNGLSA